MQNSTTAGGSPHAIQRNPFIKNIVPRSIPIPLVVSQRNRRWIPGIKPQRRHATTLNLLLQKPPVDCHLHLTGGFQPRNQTPNRGFLRHETDLRFAKFFLQWFVHVVGNGGYNGNCPRNFSRIQIGNCARRQDNNLIVKQSVTSF